MTEDQAPAEPDTPTPDPGESGSQIDETPAESQDDSTATDNWQERYEHLQPEYTRATQEASQYRQLIDLARQGDETALEYLGFELPEEDTKEDDEYRTPEDEIAELKQWKESVESDRANQAKQAELEQAEERFIEASLEALDPDDKFSDDYKQMLVYQALAHEDEDGLPDFKAAHESIQGYLESERKGWVQSKRTPQVQSGASASHQPDLDDPEQRRDYIARRIAEAEQPAA